ncbi:molybdopterin-guanine dinucleotide biosynthesis protein MobB [Ruminococcus sp. OA3]|uniref:molybdopterin-guanine dinucleotide biosynthesis protein MobB n=1 Tax=Ruminococcus sp. OA3 TaxID=2914164 RepID=UPI001F0549CE|nr:molybdopterin-guanine dinucleotide biosynthesis protein MobB [Ruminococcus sp. OA3]
MKICSIVGIRKSGKTTVVTELTKELKKRGYRVGTVKTVFCPNFSLDEEGSNTDRHKKAGADIIGVRGKREMSLIYPYGMDDNVFFPMFDVDILLAEGDYEAGVPRIVCAHRREDAEERMNPYTFLISGRIGESEERFGEIPAVNILREANKAADLIEELPDVQFPVQILKTPDAVSTFCQCGCHKTEAKCRTKNQETKKRMTVNATKLQSEGKMHIFLTGEKQVGKSTILNRVFEKMAVRPTGYQTFPLFINSQRKGNYLHGLNGIPPYENDSPISIRVEERKSVPLTETFETLGVKILEEALESDAWMLADEVGKLERDANEFQKAFFRCLDEKPVVLGVLQKTDMPFVKAIIEREDVSVLEVTVENREAVFRKILNILQSKD